MTDEECEVLIHDLEQSLEGVSWAGNTRPVAGVTLSIVASIARTVVALLKDQQARTT